MVRARARLRPRAGDHYGRVPRELDDAAVRHRRGGRTPLCSRGGGGSPARTPVVADVGAGRRSRLGDLTTNGRNEKNIPAVTRRFQPVPRTPVLAGARTG